jgi:plastocyanin
LIGLVGLAWLLWALTTTRAQAAQTVTVDIQNFAFSPDPVVIQVGDTITWTNLDDTLHSATSDAGVPMAFDTGPLSLSDSASVTFTTPGTYAYHCSFHRMSGTIVVEAPGASSTEPGPSSAETAPSSEAAAPSIPGTGVGQLPDGATGDRAAAVGTFVAAFGLFLILAVLAIAAARRDPRVR